MRDPEHSFTMKRPALVIHGGTGGRPNARRLEAIRHSLRAICEEAYAYLASRSAVEGVACAVRRLEADPLFNAGIGSIVQADGVARMSASIMDGAAMRFAGVVNIERVRHPVDVASALLGEEDRVLAGPGATQFAQASGMPLRSSADPVQPMRSPRGTAHDRVIHETVGAVALDRRGRLAAATSTGGKRGQRVGRVSDSGLPVGNYANAHVAISCTGIGEEIIEEGLAVRIAQRVADGASLSQACVRTFRELRQRRRRMGAIALDRTGCYAVSTTLPILFAVTRLPDQRIEHF